MLTWLADRIADRLATRLEGRLDAIESAMEGRLVRTGRTAAARVLARKKAEPMARAIADAEAALLEPPEVIQNGAARRSNFRMGGTWDSR